MTLKIYWVILLAWSVPVSAGWETKCAQVKRVYSWAQGSDRYGVRAVLTSQPESCGGFWVQHSAENKQYIFSMLLSAAMSGVKTCIQYDPEEEKHDGMCRVNFTYIESEF